jgi:hypothetical protein
LKHGGGPTLFPYNVLKVATKNFHMSNKLGEGGFGAVFKVCKKTHCYINGVDAEISFAHNQFA